LRGRDQQILHEEGICGGDYRFLGVGERRGGEQGSDLF